MIDRKKQFITNLRHPGTVFVLVLFAVAFLAIVVIAMGSTLNAVFIISLAALFLVCLSLIPNDELNAFLSILGMDPGLCLLPCTVGTNCYIQHCIRTWTTYNYYTIAFITFISALTDAVISWALFIIITIIRKGRWDWGKPWNWKAVLFIMGLALIGQTIGEVFALRTGRWSYGPSMPVIPILGVGLTPLLQMPLLIPITLWLAQRATCLTPLMWRRNKEITDANTL